MRAGMRREAAVRMILIGAGLGLRNVAAIAGITGLIAGGGVAALAKIGGGLVVMGLGALLFLPCKSLVLWLFELCGRFFKWIKKQFVKKNVKD